MPGGLPAELGLNNLGLAQLADGPAAQGAPVVTLDWQPPGRGDPELARLCAELADDQAGLGARIAAGNQLALERLISAAPRLVDVRPAGEALAGMTPTTI